MKGFCKFPVAIFFLLICLLPNHIPAFQEMERLQDRGGSRFLLDDPPPPPMKHSTVTVDITEAPENGTSLRSAIFSVRFRPIPELQAMPVRCRLDYEGGIYIDWQECTSPYGIQLDKDGRYILRLTVGRDPFFSTPINEVTTSWILDRSPPTTQFLPPQLEPMSNTAIFHFNGSDDMSPVSSYTCQLDYQEWTSCTSPHEITDLECGTHIFRVKAIDAAGNVDQTPPSYSWDILSLETDHRHIALYSSSGSSPSGLSVRRVPSMKDSASEDPKDDDSGYLNRVQSHLLLSLLIIVFGLIGAFFVCLGIYKCYHRIYRHAVDMRVDGGGSHLTSLESDIWCTVDTSAFSSFMSSSWPEDLRRFKYVELLTATSGFPDAGLLGEGGFGKVYAGTLDDGRAVAVKKLEKSGQQGDREFFVEVATLCRARHRNVLHLFGVCIEDGNRVCVFELMEWGSARSLLDACDLRFTWDARLRAAVGAARGLACLHESVDPPILHRDLKSENILMDNYGEARISDFGLCTLSHQEAKQRHLRRQATLTVGTIRGTFGYLAPEVIRYGRVSTKSDVYAFGVFLLEILTGRNPIETGRPVHEQDLVKWILGSIDKPEQIMRAVDPLIASDMAASCLHDNPSIRPTALSAGRRLEEILLFEEFVDRQGASMKGKSKKGSKGKMVELCLVPRLSETSGTIPSAMPFSSCMSEGDATPHAATTPIASTSSGRMAESEFLSRRGQESSTEQPSPHGIFSPTHKDHGIDPGPSAAVDSTSQ